MIRTFLTVGLIVASASLSACASTKAAEAQAQKEALDARHRDSQSDFDKARSQRKKDGDRSPPSSR